MCTVDDLSIGAQLAKENAAQRSRRAGVGADAVVGFVVNHRALGISRHRAGVEDSTAIASVPSLGADPLGDLEALQDGSDPRLHRHHRSRSGPFDLDLRAIVRGQSEILAQGDVFRVQAIADNDGAASSRRINSGLDRGIWAVTGTEIAGRRSEPAAACAIPEAASCSAAIATVGVAILAPLLTPVALFPSRPLVRVRIVGKDDDAELPIPVPSDRCARRFGVCGTAFVAQEALEVARNPCQALSR